MTAPSLVAIVTARGGSKRLPGKNLMTVGDRTLVAHAIMAGRDCALVAETVLTTDDAAIAAAGAACGATVIHRPAELAADATRSEPVVRHVLDSLADRGRRFDQLVLLQPTSPLRRPDHVTACVTTFRASGCRSAISVMVEPHPPQKSLVLRDGRLEPLFSHRDLSRPRQELPPVYRPNGAVYVIGCDDFRAADAFFVPPVMPFVMTAEDSVDIDDALDLDLARLIWARRRPAG
jgi:N-acylneuraminate cytidylyltransferase/CMP-N,N'-diacetyllegionaminic acid synthase